MLLVRWFKDNFMLSVLLRSGDIKNYTALGQDGTPVYAVASQLRDTIKVRVKSAEDKNLGKKFANYLAVPQRNDQGSQIDWYVPFESEQPDGQYMIIPWTSATEEERSEALKELGIFERGMLEFGQTLKNTDNLKGDLLLFSRILSGGASPSNLYDPDNLKALRFPSPEYVYLVNNRPVITFWGFVEKNTVIHGNPFLNLQPKQSSVITSPSLTQSVEPSVQKKKGCLRWLLFLLPFLLLSLLVLFLLRGCLPFSVNLPGFPVNTVLTNVDNKDLISYERCLNGRIYQFNNGVWISSDGSEVQDKTLISQLTILKEPNLEQCNASLSKKIIDSEPAKIVSTEGVSGLIGTDDYVDRTASDSDVIKEQQNMPLESETDKNSLEELPKVENPSDLDNKALQENNELDNKDTTVPPIDISQNENVDERNKPLNLPDDANKLNNLDFLNGKWNAGSGIQDKTTGKPLRLKYDFNDGKGQVRVERGDGVQCVGDVTAAMHGKGLSISNSGIANCTDGSTYQLPNVTCQPDSNGKANCQGEYGQGKKFPITIKSN